MQNFAVLQPAYGRTYSNAVSAWIGFLRGEDWRDARTMQYCSIRDFSEGIWFIELRFGKRLESFRLVELDNGKII